MLEPLYKPPYRILYPVGLIFVGGGINSVLSGELYNLGVGSAVVLTGSLYLLYAVREDIRSSRKK